MQRNENAWCMDPWKNPELPRCLPYTAIYEEGAHGPEIQIKKLGKGDSGQKA